MATPGYYRATYPPASSINIPTLCNTASRHSTPELEIHTVAAANRRAVIRHSWPDLVFPARAALQHHPRGRKMARTPAVARRGRDAGTAAAEAAGMSCRRCSTSTSISVKRKPIVDDDEDVLGNWVVAERVLASGAPLAADVDAETDAGVRCTVSAETASRLLMPVRADGTFTPTDSGAHIQWADNLPTRPPSGTSAPPASPTGTWDLAISRAAVEELAAPPSIPGRPGAHITWAASPEQEHNTAAAEKVHSRSRSSCPRSSSRFSGSSKHKLGFISMQRRWTE